MFRLTVGMEDAEGSVLKSINGIKVLNLKHVYSILTSEVFSVLFLWRSCLKKTKQKRKDLPEMVQLVFGDDMLCVFKKSQVLAKKARMLKRNKIAAETNLFDVQDQEDN